MPNATHVRLAATAKRLIRRHGRPVELVTRANSGDPWEPVRTPESMQQIVGVQTKHEQEKDKELQARVAIDYLLDSTIEPLLHMRLRDSGVDYPIKKITLIKPGLTSVIYSLECAV